MQDIAGTTLTPEGLARIRATDISLLPRLDAGSRFGKQRQLTKAWSAWVLMQHLPLMGEGYRLWI